jgi:hypothetical protein
VSYTIINILAHVPFYVGGAVALWSLWNDLKNLWRRYVW